MPQNPLQIQRFENRVQQPEAAGSLHQLAELRGVPLQGLGPVKGKGLTGIRKSL